MLQWVHWGQPVVDDPQCGGCGGCCGGCCGEEVSWDEM